MTTDQSVKLRSKLLTDRVGVAVYVDLFLEDAASFTHVLEVHLQGHPVSLSGHDARTGLDPTHSPALAPLPDCDTNRHPIRRL